MFRHPNLNTNKGTFDDVTFNTKVDQSIRYFNVPALKNKEDALNLLLQKITNETVEQTVGSKIRKIYFTVGSIAAAACIALFFVYSFFLVETHTGTNQSSSNVVFLPDNSRVFLADGATVTVSHLFNQRNVKLEGEAYFEVKKGSDFYVKTNEGGVLVIGTRFSVNSSNQSLLVHCFEGVVGVDYNKQKVKISEGVQFSGMNKTSNIVEDNNIGYPGFALFNYSCENKHLNELWPLVEQYFGVEIENVSSTPESFTGSFHTGNVQEVIDIVCTSMKISYEVIDEDVVRIK
ncbi:MAG: FecR family protein [Prolixibacteraceae bacterium]|jgi:transmembrane sensor|nr:FecR family protein [Prolixibacteraceae bacterium]